MTMERSVKDVIVPTAASDGAGVRLSRSIATPHLDPFFLFDHPFLVYAREGDRCPRCRRADIRRLVQAQRATFYCPRCQR